LVCSPIEKLHDLSLNRCETGWILSLDISDFLVRKELKSAIIVLKKKKKKKTENGKKGKNMYSRGIDRKKEK